MLKFAISPTILFFFYQKMNRWEKPVTLAQDEPINLNEFKVSKTYTFHVPVLLILYKWIQKWDSTIYIKKNM